MALNTHITQTAVDFSGLNELRRSATVDQKDQETLEQVAGQFESLFVGMMLKGMRQASLGEGIFDSSQSDMYRDMSDQQLAMDLSAKGGLGLREVIMRQLGGQIESKVSANSDVQAYGMDTVPVRSALQSIDNPALFQKIMQAKPEAKIHATDMKASAQQTAITFDSPESFVQKLLPMAKQAAQRIGVSPEVILSQAALETGWGQHVIKQADGKSSHNLFNIKADSRWQGEHATTGTVEYRDGVAVKEQAQFRSYDNYQDSFNDYVDFLQTQPRYQNALKQTHDPEQFIEGLHKAGYATDPGYADKIKKIMNSSTLAQISQQLQHS
jgi:flagellar protein FlgJ